MKNSKIGRREGRKYAPALLIGAALALLCVGCGPSQGEQPAVETPHTIAGSPAADQPQQSLVITLTGAPTDHIGGIEVTLSLPDGVTVNAEQDGGMTELSGAGGLSAGSFSNGQLHLITISLYGMLDRDIFRVPLHGRICGAEEISFLSMRVLDADIQDVPGAGLTKRIIEGEAR